MFGLGYQKPRINNPGGEPGRELSPAEVERMQRAGVRAYRNGQLDGSTGEGVDVGGGAFSNVGSAGYTGPTESPYAIPGTVRNPPIPRPPPEAPITPAESMLLGQRNVQNYQPGVGMSAPLQDLSTGAAARGNAGQATLGAYGGQAAAYGNQAATYGVGAAQGVAGSGDAAMRAGNSAAAYGSAAANQGANLGAYGMAQGQNITAAGNSAAMTGALANQRAQGAANQIGAMGQSALGQSAYGQGLASQGTQAQMGAANQLAGLENQEGPSAAQAQLRNAMSANLQDQLALAGSGRGYGGGAAAKAQALRALPGMQANAANQSSMLRAQENAAWRQRQGQNLAGAAGAYGQAAQSGIAQGQLGLAGVNTATGALTQGANVGLAGANTALSGYGQQASAAQAAGQMGLAGGDRALAGLGMGMQGANAQMQGAQTQGQLRSQAGQLGLAGFQQGTQGATAAAAAAGQGFGLGFQGDTLRGQTYGQDMAAKQNYEQMLTQIYGIDSGVGIAQQQADAQYNAAMINAGSTLAAGIIPMLSDERQKNIGQPVKLSSGFRGNPYGRRGAPDGMVMSDERNKRELETLRSEVGAYRSAYGAPNFRGAPSSAYEYKDPSIPGAEPGVHVGPMAQDLEKAAPGVVQETPYGKMVNTPRLTMQNSSAIGEQQARQDDLEAQFAELRRMLDEEQRSPYRSR